MQPRIEPLDVSKRGQVAPGAEQRLLRSILRAVRVAEDPVREGVSAVGAGSGDGRERISVPSLRPLDQLDLHRLPSAARLTRPRQGVWNRPTP